MPKLILVPTPIGNLEDITLRALKVLRSVPLILAEDTRTSGLLLQHYEIKCPMQSYHKYNEHQALERLCDRIEQEGEVALITDAGTPAISDPGYLLVRACLERGIEVECLPGATAFVPALVISGLPSDRFSFEGFLPAKKGRQTKLRELAQRDHTMILYESPHRLFSSPGPPHRSVLRPSHVSAHHHRTPVLHEGVTHDRTRPPRIRSRHRRGPG